MDLHLNKINIGAVADRAARGVGLVGLLALTLGPLPLQQANPATAGSLSWGNIDSVIASPGKLQAVAAADASNGDVFAVAGMPDGASKVFRSTNGGIDWQPEAGQLVRAVDTPAVEADPDASPAVIGVPATYFNCTIQDLRISPEYEQDGTLVALCTQEANPLAISRDNGNNWDLSGALVSGTTPTAFDIAPNFDGSDGGDIVVGTTGASTAISYARWTGSEFTDFTVPSSDHAASNERVLAISFSPRYTNVSRVVRIIRTSSAVREDRATITRGTGITGPSGDWEAASPVVNVVDSGNSDAVNDSATIVWPSDVESSAANYWVGLSLADTGDVYRNSGNFQPLNVKESAPTKVTGLASRGTFDDATLYAVDSGANSYRSTNGGDSWRSSEAIEGDDSIKSIGDGATSLAVDGGGTLYAGTTGSLGGLHKSTNGGSSWSDTGLTNEDYSKQVLDLHAVNGATLFGVFSDGNNTAVFRTDNEGSSGDWVRVDRSDKVTRVECSPNVAADGGCYLLRSDDGGDQILRSTNGGNSFDTTDSGPTDDAYIRSMEVISSSTVFVGSSDGRVIRTSDGGFNWDMSSTDLGNDVVAITASPEFATDNTLLAAARGTAGAFEVWMSTDGGATFTKLGSSSGAWGNGSGNSADAWGQLEFSPLYPTDMNVYFVPDGNASDDEIFRKDLSATKNWDEAGYTLGQSGEPYSQIFLFAASGSPDGYALYASRAKAGEFDRTYKPLSGRASADWLLSDNDGTATFGRNGGNAYYAGQFWMINTAGTNKITSWSDSNPFNSGVSLTSPLPGGSVPTNTGDNGQPVAFNWQEVRSDTDRYRIEVALDPNFVSLLESTVVSVPFLSLGTNKLGDGAIYWWRVRVEAADKAAGDGDTPVSATDNLAQNPGPWSTAQNFSVGSTGAPTAPTPSLPLNNSQLPGLSTNLSWNNPSGTTQVQVQVTPLNGDGPGIDLIYGSSISNYSVPAPSFGVGPYVMLPGATYTWRVRTTRATTSIGSDDSSWGPFSDPRTFTTAAPNAGTIQELAPINGDATSDTTPTLQWKDANAAMFYYEIQLSSDPNFGEAGAVAPVYWNLIHAGVTTPPSSWTVPDSAALAAGTYYWRARQRVQATPLGSAETGIAWTPAQMFVVQ